MSSLARSQPAPPLLLLLLLSIAAAYLSGMPELLSAEATTVRVRNSCSGTVCAKSWVPNSSIGGRCSQLAPGGTWSIGVNAGWSAATIWAITNTGCGGQNCNTGPPGVTQFEFTIAGGGGNDYYDVSVLAGYNIGMRVVPTANCPSIVCRGTTAATCPSGYYPGGPDATKACATGTSDYDVYLCG